MTSDHSPISTHRTARTTPRAEAVGSLLRPDKVKAAVDALFANQTCGLKSLVPPERAGELRDLNLLIDGEVRRLVQKQIDCGLDVVTDGELRRSSFLSSFQDSVDGLAAPDERLIVRDDGGAIVYETYGEPVIVSRLRKAFSPLAEEAAFLRSVSSYPFKVMLPAPSYFYTDFDPVSGNAYARDRNDLVADIVAIEKRLVAEAIAAGARYIQFDFPVYPALVDRAYTDRLLSSLGGGTAEGLLSNALAADIAVTASIPDDVTVSLHLCRGNVEGGFWNGSLAPIAERMFGELPHDRFLFEWEDLARDGDYEPIKYVRKGQVMAMGVVSTKTPEIEGDDEIVRRLEAAARFLPMEQLALTTQCGFASFCGDHLVEAEDAQWRKLEMIGRVADRVWGSN